MAGEYATSALMGVDIDARDTTPQFALGTGAFGVNDAGAPLIMRYVQANGSIAASQTDITVSVAGQASDGSGTWDNSVAFADNEYGWVWLPVNT